MVHARLVGPKYEHPNRYVVGGPLLPNNYEQVANKNKVELLKDANSFGLTVLGDRAIIKNKPLFNVLTSSLCVGTASRQVKRYETPTMGSG